MTPSLVPISVWSLAFKSGTLALVIIGSIAVGFSLVGLARRIWSFFLGDLELEEALIRNLVVKQLPSLQRREQRTFAILDERDRRAHENRRDGTSWIPHARVSNLAKFPDMIDG